MNKFLKQVKRSVGIRSSPRSTDTVGSDEENSPLASSHPQQRQQRQQQQQQQTQHHRYGSDQESIINHLIKRSSEVSNDHDIDVNEDVDVLANANTSQASDKAQSRWKKICNKVDTGELLLMGPQHQSEREQSSIHRDRSLAQQLRSKAVEEMQAALDFSVWQCLLAVVLYVAVAVVVYSFIFDNMTIIDAM